MNEALERAEEEHESLDVPEPRRLATKFYLKKNRQIDSLLAREETTGVDVKAGCYSFDLREPILCERIVLKVEDFPRYADVKIEWKTADGQRHEQKVRVNNDEVEADVGALIIGLEITIPKKYFTSYARQIVAIDVYGYDVELLDQLAGEMTRVWGIEDSIQQALSHAQDKISTAEAQYNELRENIAEVNSNIAETKEEYEEAIAELDVKKNEDEEFRAKLARLKDEVSTTSKNLDNVTHQVEARGEERKEINKEIAQKQSELAELKSEINTFPEELSEFRKEGYRSAKVYIGLSIIPILILFGVTGYLFYHGFAFAEATKELSGKEVVLRTLGRVPFVTISLTIVGACYALARVFIAEIIAINKQRLSLTKIGIIAKDVSEASGYGLDLSEDELYERRTLIKMDLLRKHLEEYLGKDFSFKLRWPWYHLKEIKNEASEVTEEVEEEDTEE